MVMSIRMIICITEYSETVASVENKTFLRNWHVEQFIQKQKCPDCFCNKCVIHFHLGSAVARFVVHLPSIVREEDMSLTPHTVLYTDGQNIVTCTSVSLYTKMEKKQFYTAKMPVRDTCEIIMKI